MSVGNIFKIFKKEEKKEEKKETKNKFNHRQRIDGEANLQTSAWFRDRKKKNSSLWSLNQSLSFGSLVIPRAFRPGKISKILSEAN